MGKPAGMLPNEKKSNQPVLHKRSPGRLSLLKSYTHWPLSLYFSYICRMFFILSKTISYLILPVTMLAILLLLFLFSKRHGLKKWSLALFVTLFFLFTNPFLVGALMRWWEWPATPISELQEEYEAAIVLSGVTASGMEPTDRVHLHKGADRIMHTVQLYKLGKIRKIILSGGSGLLVGEQESSEANEMRKVMLISGVAEEDILLEEDSRNTYENATYSAKLLEESNISQDKLLLVTSAFHMRRSLGCFQQAGLQPEPYSTDFYTEYPAKYTPDSLLIPSGGALMNWTRLLQEWTGYIMYSLLGYI